MYPCNENIEGKIVDQSNNDNGQIGNLAWKLDKKKQILQIMS